MGWDGKEEGEGMTYHDIIIQLMQIICIILSWCQDCYCNLFQMPVLTDMKCITWEFKKNGQTWFLNGLIAFASALLEIIYLLIKQIYIAAQFMHSDPWQHSIHNLKS